VPHHWQRVAHNAWLFNDWRYDLYPLRMPACFRAWSICCSASLQLQPPALLVSMVWRDISLQNMQRTPIEEVIKMGSRKMWPLWFPNRRLALQIAMLKALLQSEKQAPNKGEVSTCAYQPSSLQASLLLWQPSVHLALPENTIIVTDLKISFTKKAA